jgi:hypothetical protein
MPFLKLFDFIPSWCWALICAAAMVFAGTQYELKLGADHALDKVRVEVAQKETARANAAREATEIKLAFAEFRTLKTQEMNNALHAEKEKTRVAVASSAVTGKLLNDATAALNTRGSSVSADPAAQRRAEDRAEAFGLLLGQCDRMAESLGAETEGLATQVRGLQAAYALLDKPAVGAKLGGLENDLWLSGRLLLAGGPEVNGLQADPHPATLGVVEVDTPLPEAPVDPRVDRVVGLVREVPLVGLQRNPALQHVVDDEAFELFIRHLAN